MKTNQTLKEILMEVWDCGYTIDTPDTQGMSVDQALKQISELLVECKPKKKRIKNPENGTYDYEQNLMNSSYNKCIDDYIKNIKDLL